MNIDEKFNLITRNLEEIILKDKIKEILKKRDLHIYWGTAPTGKPHIGYLIPLIKLSDFLEANSKVTILIADLHAFLDAQKTPEKLLKARSEYYEEVLKETLKALKVDVSKLNFVKGTDYQLSKDYIFDVYRFMNLVTVAEAKKAGAEVVKQSDTPKLAPIVYPLLQALDEQYLNVDAQFGGLDQRKIFVLAHEYLPKLGYEQRIHLMNPLLPGLTGGKMSASNINSKIDLLDPPEVIKSKLKKAYCPAGEKENNPVLLFIKYVIFPYLKRINELYVIERPEKYGGNLEFTNYDDLENHFISKEIHPLDLKNSVANYLIKILEPLKNNARLKTLADKAYN